MCTYMVQSTPPFQLTLEFYEKKARWLLPAEITNWEVWHLQLFIFDPASEEGGCGLHAMHYSE